MESARSSGNRVIATLASVVSTGQIEEESNTLGVFLKNSKTPSFCAQQKLGVTLHFVLDMRSRKKHPFSVASGESLKVLE